MTNSLTFDPFTILWDKTQILNILLYYIFLAIPFFFSGICIAMVLSNLTKKVNKLYFSNLVGSGFGAISILFLFPLMGSNAIITVPLIGFLSTLSFSLNFRKAFFPSLIGLFIVISLFAVQFEINISPYKDLNIQLRYPDSKILFTGWNSFSRVDVIDSGGVRFAPGLSPEFKGKLPKQFGLTVDGGDLNAITSFENLEFLDFLPISLPYTFKDIDNVLVLNPNGGMGILLGLKNDVESIKAVELNPIIFHALKDEFGEFSGNIYSEKGVEVRIDELRNFLKTDKEKYDLIEISLTGGVLTTGLYNLNENYLFTIEGFEDIYEHLEEDGMLSVTRFLFFPPKDSIKLVSLSLPVLERQGVENPEKQIALIRTWTTSTFILKKGELNQEETNRIREFCGKMKFDIIYLPDVREEEVNYHNRFPEPYYYLAVIELLENRTKFVSNYLFDVFPPTDDKPYFFNYFRFEKFSELYESMGKKWEPFFEGGFLIAILFIQALVISFMFILLPLYKVGKRPVLKGKLVYFFCIGIGFMFIEISLIQKFILFLGHPMFSISTVVFSLLLFSGLGSLFSGRFKIKGKTLNFAILSLASLTLLYTIVIPLTFEVLGYDLFIRYVISILLLAPLGFLMGIPFPFGMRILDKLDRKAIPWARAVNACSSVLGSILAMVIAISFGFSLVLVLAAIVYLAGLGMIQKF